MDLSVGEAPMTRRHKRKAWVQAKRKVKEAQADGNSAEEEAGTEDGLDPAWARLRAVKRSPTRSTSAQSGCVEAGLATAAASRSGDRCLRQDSD